MKNKSDLERYRANRQGEIDSIFLYSALAKVEKNPQISTVYKKLAVSEAKHAEFWEKKIKEAGGTVSVQKPGLRPRVLGLLAGWFGPRFVLPIVTTLEHADRDSYDAQPEARGTSLPQDERSHARLIQAISQGAKKGMEGSALARLEGRHRVVGGNALRAAVLGANDGLVSNLSLIMGVAGANLSNSTILVTGLAGLLAGASSMAMGEWLSVQSSRELYEKQIEVEAEELRLAPEEEEEELALIYEAKGISQLEAKKLAAAIIKDQPSALRTLSREELGIDPDSLGGSAWGASITSFVLFALGALVPLIPFIFFKEGGAATASLGFSAAALFLVGALITLFTGINAFYSGSRQLLLGLTAAGITYGIGRLIGTVIAG